MFIYIMNESSGTYSNLSLLLKFLCAWFFGFKITLLCVFGYCAYKTKEVIMMCSFTTMLLYYLFGFWFTASSLFFVGVYVAIIKKDMVKQLLLSMSVLYD